MAPQRLRHGGQGLVDSNQAEKAPPHPPPALAKERSGGKVDPDVGGHTSFVKDQDSLGNGDRLRVKR